MRKAAILVKNSLITGVREQRGHKRIIFKGFFNLFKKSRNGSMKAKIKIDLSKIQEINTNNKRDWEQFKKCTYCYFGKLFRELGTIKTRINIPSSSMTILFIPIGNGTELKFEELTCCKNTIF